MLKPLPLVALAMFGCVACTVLSSKTIDDLAEADRKPSGTFYSLPLGVVEFELSVVPQKAAFTLSIGQTSYVPDPAHRYYLQYRPLPNYDDIITVKTDSRSFLTSVSATTQDRTPDIVVNVAKTLTVLGTLEAAQIPEDSLTLAKITLDPTDPVERENAIKALNAKIEAYVKTAREACKYYETKKPETPNPHNCRYLQPPSSTTPSDAALFHYGCVLKGYKTETEKAKAPKTAPATPRDYDPKEEFTDYERAIRDATVVKQLIDAQIADIISPQANRQLTIALNYRCPEPPSADANEDAPKLCKLLREQAEADKTLKTLTSNLDRINGKVSAIRERRKGQTDYCKLYASAPPKAGMRVVDYRDAVLGKADPAESPQQQWHSVLHRAQDCSAGLCYRPKEPYKIVFGIETRDGYAVDTAIVELPNRASPVLIDIRRAFFVKKVQEIEFDKDGTLTTVHINKPSELLAVSKLPLDILDAVLEGFKIRVDLLNKQRDIAKREAALIDAQTKLYGTRTRLESASVKSETALESAPTRPIRGGATSW